MRADSPERLSLAGLAIFSSPMIVVMAIEIAWRIYLPSFFATTLGLSLGAVGALLMAARLFDTVVDPAIGWASDLFPTRYGHRRPWLVASVPLIMLGAAGVFFVWPWTNLATLAVSCLLLHLGYMMLVTPHGGWALELARDPRDQLRIMGAKTWLSAAGMIVILLLPAVFESGLGTDRQGQVAVLGILLVLLCPLCVFLVVRRVAEPAFTPSGVGDAGNPLRLFIDIVRMRALQPILLLYLFSGFAEAACSATFLFLIEDGLALKGWGSILLLIQSAAVLATLPLWRRVCERIGRIPVLMVAAGWQIAIMPLALLLPSGDVAAAMGFLVLRSLFSGVDFMLLRAMVADVVQDAAATGARRGASCYSVSNITLKLAMGGGAWFALSAIGAGDAAMPAFVDIGPTHSNMVRLAYVFPAVMTNLLALALLCLMTMRKRALPPERAPQGRLHAIKH